MRRSYGSVEGLRHRARARDGGEPVERTSGYDRAMRRRHLTGNSFATRTTDVIAPLVAEMVEEIPRVRAEEET